MTNKEKFIKAAELAALWEDFVVGKVSAEEYFVATHCDSRCFNAYIEVYQTAGKLNHSLPEAASILMSEAYA